MSPPVLMSASMLLSPSSTIFLVGGVLLCFVLLLFKELGRSVDPLDAGKRFLHPRGSTISRLLQERSQANARLKNAFRLTNTFVSDRIDTHKFFVSQAAKILSTARHRGWVHLQRLIVDATRWQLAGMTKDEDSISFSVAIQNITLVVVLMGILDVTEDADTFSHTEIGIVAQRINALWDLSKKPEPIPSHLLDELNTLLRRIVPNHDTYINPLDYVIPTWETLWRVVATTIAYSHSDSASLSLLRELHSEPDDGQFSVRREGGISVSNIVCEAIRLHPPSKRIGRSRARFWWAHEYFQGALEWVAPGCAYTTSAVDVERLMKSEDIWGSDALAFRAARHSEGGDGLTEEEVKRRKECLGMAFGHGPLRCIAASWAPMAVGVVSAGVLSTLEEERMVIRRGERIGGRSGWDGWEIRRASA